MELAVLLPTLSEGSNDDIDDFLVRFGTFDQRAAAWISGFARVLYRDRASNQEFRVAEVLAQLVASARTFDDSSIRVGRNVVAVGGGQAVNSDLALAA